MRNNNKFEARIANLEAAQATTNTKMASIEAKLDQILAVMASQQQKPAPTPKPAKNQTASKKDKEGVVVYTREQNRQRVYAALGWSNPKEQFNREQYEAKAKELGVYYKGKVVATVK